MTPIFDSTLSGMLIISLDAETLTKHLEEFYSTHPNLDLEYTMRLALFLSPNKTIISGIMEHLKLFKNFLRKEKKQGCQFLKVHGAFHSPLLTQIKDEYRDFL